MGVNQILNSKDAQECQDSTLCPHKCALLLLRTSNWEKDQGNNCKLHTTINSATCPLASAHAIPGL